MHKWVFVIFTFFFSSAIFALQTKLAKDNERLFIKISAKEFSKISVANDKIISVKGQSNLYEIKQFKDPLDQGMLFIKPAAFYQQRMFSIFITTEGAHHYTLLLKSMDIPAETIEITPLTASQPIATHWEMNLPYTQTLVTLMKAMRNAEQPEGYAVVSFKHSPTKKLNDHLTMRFLTAYCGGFLNGEIWRLKNISPHPIDLYPQGFYQSFVRSIAITNEHLKSGQETIMYRIVTHA